MKENSGNAVSLAAEAFHKFFWDAYDNLGRLMLVNLAWFAFTVPLLLTAAFRHRMPRAVFFFLFPASSFLSVLAAASAFYLVFRLMEKQEFGIIAEFIAGMRKFLKKGTALGAISLAIALAGFIDIRFYLGIRSSKLLALILAGAGAWIVFAAWLMQNYTFPLMAQRELGVKDNLRTSAGLVLDNFGFTLIIFLQSFLLVFCCGISIIGFPVFMVSLPALLLNGALKMLSVRKYGMPGEITEEKRGWKEFWQPWKS